MQTVRACKNKETLLNCTDLTSVPLATVRCNFTFYALFVFPYTFLLHKIISYLEKYPSVYFYDHT